MNSERFYLNKSRLVLLVALLFALLGASIFRTPPILFLAAVLCCAPVAAALVGRFSCWHLSIHREFPAVGRVGEAITTRITLLNRGAWPIFLIQARWISRPDTKTAELALQPWGEDEHIEPMLAPHGRVTWEESWRLTRRGCHLIPGVGAGSIDPLGLTSRLSVHTPAQPILVLPRAYPLARLGWTGDRFGGSRPPLQTARVAEASDFRGIRVHQPGEGLRRVHWKSTARTGQLHIVEWEEEMACDLTLLLDVQTSVHVGVPGDDSLEAAVSIAATIATFLLQNGHFCGLMWLENDPTGARREARLKRIEARNLSALPAVLAALAQLQPCGAPGATLAQLANLAAPHLVSQSGLLLLSTERAEVDAAWTTLASSVQGQNQKSRSHEGQILLLDAASWAQNEAMLTGARATESEFETSNFQGAVPAAGLAARRLKRGDSIVALLERGA